MVGTHHYQEIACIVKGTHGASIIVAAAPGAEWNRFSPVLEQAVAAYTVQ